ncbi:hypothetical protein ZIOFF_038624 [Zingiber officinale]|uniref:60S acidic ribosomal protein P1 n=1 Tax=Zingiber officinale TaxID=94328 RepID=A0A8J5GA20_ZINOF|nr:hypothetical protein ZIOFF_038624 [Zingiber officinale]
MASLGELACTYAALVLHDDGISITVSRILEIYHFLSESYFSFDALWLCANLIDSFVCLFVYDQSEKISTLVKAANLTIDSFWASLFAKLLEKRSVDDLILSLGSGGGAASLAISAAPAAAGGAAPAAAAAAEEKKEEPKEESDEDMGFSLFD